MAITETKAGSGRQFVYFNAVSATAKHLSAEEAAQAGEKKFAGFLYQEGGKNGPYKLARSLTGNIANVRLGEDEYEGRKFPVASMRLVDGDNVDEVVKFRLDQGIGRSLIGLIAASELNHGGGTIDVYINQSFAGDKWGNGTIATKDQVFINMKPAGAETSAKFKPVYVDQNGQIVTFKNDKGEDSPLPMAKKVKINGQEQWDFGEQTELAMNNARCLEAHFKTRESEVQNQAPAHDEGGIDLDEAAAAAAPRG